MSANVPDQLRYRNAHMEIGLRVIALICVRVAWEKNNTHE